MSRKLTPEEREARKAELKVYKRQWYLANREHTLAVNQAYRERNPELITRLKKEWADANREKVVRMARERRRSNPEQRKAYEATYRQWPHAKAYQRDYYMANQDTIKKRTAQWQKNNKPRHLSSVRERLLTKWLLRAGWTRDEYERRLALGCEICGNKVPRGGAGGMVFDHDHETGLVRGMLCGKCNARLDWAIEFYEQIGCYHRHSLEAVA